MARRESAGRAGNAGNWWVMAGMGGNGREWVGMGGRNIFAVIGQLIRKIDAHEERIVRAGDQKEYRQRFDTALGDCTNWSQGKNAFREIEHIVKGIRTVIQTRNPTSLRQINDTAIEVSDFIVGMCEDIERMLGDRPQKGLDYGTMIEDKLGSYLPITYETCSTTTPIYGNPSSPRALHKPMEAFVQSEGFDTIGFEESVWNRAGGGKHAEER